MATRPDMSTRHNSGKNATSGRLLAGLSPILNGLFVALLVVLTLWVAMAMSGEEQTLVAAVDTATPTSTLPAPTATAAPTQPPVASSPAASPTPTAPPPTLVTGQAVATRCVPGGDWRLYTVQAGDTLPSLARSFRTWDYILIQANCLGTNRTLWVGQQIYVPNVATPVPCGPPPGWVRYMIQPGDTLFSLALRLGISVSDLKAANCLTRDLIVAYTSLWVPRPLPTPTRPAYHPPTATARPSPTILPPGSATVEPSSTPGEGTVTATSSATTEPATATGEVAEPPTSTAEPPTSTAEPPTSTFAPPDTPVPPPDTQVPPTQTSPPPDTPVPPPPTATDAA